MKLKIPTKLLSSALALLKPVAKANKTHAILGNVALIAEKKQLRLVGMDQEKRLEITLPCNPSEFGGITIPLARLIATLATRREPECDLSISDKEAVIRCGKFTAKIPGLPVEELFRTWTDLPDGEIHFKIEPEFLKRILSRCIAHASIDDTKAVMVSVMMVARKGLLTVLATDGRRMAVYPTEIPFSADKEASYVIPLESAQSLLLAIDGEENIEVSVATGMVSAAMTNRVFSTKLIEANCPSFERVIPRDNKFKLIVNRSELLAEIKSTEVYVTEADTAVKIVCDGKELRISAGDESKLGAGAGSIEMKDGSNAHSFAINPKYLRDALESFDEEEITLLCKDDFNAILIQNKILTCCVMPIRTT